MIYYYYYYHYCYYVCVGGWVGGWVDVGVFVYIYKGLIVTTITRNNHKYFPSRNFSQ